MPGRAPWRGRRPGRAAWREGRRCRSPSGRALPDARSRVPRGRRNRSRSRTRSRRRRARTSAEDLEGERLRDEVVSARGESRDGIGVLHPRGEENDGACDALPHFAAHFESVSVRQVHVEKDDVRSAPARRLTARPSARAFRTARERRRRGRPASEARPRAAPPSRPIVRVRRHNDRSRYYYVTSSRRDR